MNFFVKNFGCKVNQFETEYFINSLISNNFTFSSVKDADIIIINSCAVTKEAERQLFQYIRKIKRENKNIKIVLTGCSVDNSLEKIKSLNLIDIVISNFYKKRLPEIVLSNIIDNSNHIFHKKISNEKNFVNLYSEENFIHTRKFFKIQDGCNNYCSYCIIPYLRGKPRSLDINQIPYTIAKYAEFYGEVVLTGINIGIYGKDLGIANGFLRLLEKIENILLQKNIKNFRIRLSSLKPDEINNNIIDFIAKSKFFTPHFHISIQNFNDKIIKLMNRNYTFKDIKICVETIKSLIPFAAIGADLITGFPGETLTEFNDNVKKIENSDINFYHIFPFSKRPGTKAATFEETADNKEKKERVKILKKLTDFKKEIFIKKNLGRNFSVLVETAENGYLSGYSENYIKIYIKGIRNFELKNKFLNVKGEELTKKLNIIGSVI